MSPTAGKAGRVSVTTSTSRALEKLDKLLKTKSLIIRAGALNGAKYANGVGVASVLNVLEHGTNDGKIPPRPILRYCATKFSKAWSLQYADYIKRGMEQSRAAALVGEMMAGDIRDTFNKTEGIFIKNAAATVAGKGFDHPLVDTSHMLKSITYEVLGGAKNVGRNKS